MSLPVISYVVTILIAQGSFVGALIYTLRPKYNWRPLFALMWAADCLPVIPGISYVLSQGASSTGLMLVFAKTSYTLVLAALALCFRDQLWRKAAAFAALTLVAVIGTELKGIVFGWLFGREHMLSAVYSGGELAASIVMEGVALGLLILTAWLMKKLLRSSVLSRRAARLVGLGASLFIAVDYVLLFFVSDESLIGQATGGHDWNSLAWQVCLLALLVLLLYLVVVWNDKRLLSRRVAELERAKQQQYDIFLTQQAQSEQIYKLQHDLENHLTTVQTLLSQGQQEQAGAYFDQLLEQYRDRRRQEYCQHAVANIVLQNKAEECHRLDIDFSVEVNIPAACIVSDMDMVCLLTNLLDNAIKAAAQSREKSIVVLAAPRASWLALRIENSRAADKTAPLPETERNGWGLKIIDEIISKYDGELKADMVAGAYCVSVMLPCQ